MEGKFDPVHELKMEGESIEVNYDLDGRLVLSYSKKKKKRREEEEGGEGSGF